MTEQEREIAQLNVNLTSVQERCTTLLLEKRELSATAAELREMVRRLQIDLFSLGPDHPATTGASEDSEVRLASRLIDLMKAWEPSTCVAFLAALGDAYCRRCGTALDGVFCECPR